MNNYLLKSRIVSIKYPKALFAAVVIVFSFITFLVCVNNPNFSYYYTTLYLLPLFHCFISMLFFCFLFKGDFYTDLPVLIIYIALTVRNVLTPFAMVFDGYTSILGIPSNSSAHKAILVMIYETFSVLAIIIIYKKMCHLNSRKNKVKKRFKSKFIFGSVIFSAILISMVSFVILPELRSQYYSIFTSDITHLAKESYSYSSGIKRMFASASELIIEATRLTVCTIIIVRLRKRGERRLNYTLCLILILFQFLFMTDSNAYIIMLALTLFIVTCRLFPSYSKKTFRRLVIVIFVFGILLYKNRFALDHYGSSMSKFLQAYFPGVANFCGVEQLLPRSIGTSLNQIFIDLYAAVPFRSTLFGYSGGLIDLPTLWNKANGVSGQIMPTVAQSYYYFGSFFSPLLSCIITLISLKAFNKAKHTDNPIMFGALIFLSIYGAISVVMYDFYIFSKGFTNRILFMMLFAYFSDYSIRKITGETVGYERE